MLDCFNQSVSDYSICITTRISESNHYFVIVEDEEPKK